MDENLKGGSVADFISIHFCVEKQLQFSFDPMFQTILLFIYSQNSFASNRLFVIVTSSREVN